MFLPDSEILQSMEAQGLLPDASAVNLTESILTQYLNFALVDTDITTWSFNRKRVAVEQILCQMFLSDKNADVYVGAYDGLVGPATRYAFEVYNRLKAGKPATDNSRDINMATSVKPTSTYTINYERRAKLPTQSECMSFYGPIDSNQVSIQLPYPLKLSWDLSSIRRTLTCHKLVADDMTEAFTYIKEQYSAAEITQLRLDITGGCLNPRKMRGGTAWSMHSWGIAIDMDPDNNTLKMPWKEAPFSRPEYVPFINAWLRMGWVSLGLEHNMDAQHFQAAVVRRG